MLACAENFQYLCPRKFIERGAWVWKIPFPHIAGDTRDNYSKGMEKVSHFQVPLN